MNKFRLTFLLLCALNTFLLPASAAQNFPGLSDSNTLAFKTAFAALMENKISLTDRQAILGAAEDGNAAAMAIVADSFASGSFGFAKDEAKAKEWTEKAAEKGAYEALVTLGERYEKGLGLPRRPLIAETYYEQASKAGFTPAKTRLATLFLQTKIKTEANRAADLLREASQGGDMVAARILGFLFLDGIGVQKDLNQAETLFLAAANRGDPLATRGVGLVYLTTSTSPLYDAKKAELWLEKAATRGDVEAPFFLALAYTGTYGFPINAEKSDAWLKQGERFFQQVQKPLLYAALSKRTMPYFMSDGALVHAIDGTVTFEAKDGSVTQHGAGKINMVNFDSAKNPSSIRLDLYPCGKQKGAVDFSQADSLVEKGNFVDAIIELRKECGAEKTSAWLKRRAEEGYAQLQIEYGDWLRKTQTNDAAFWAILGYIRMKEDVVLCQDSSARGGPTVLLSRYRPLIDMTNKLPKERYLELYEKAVIESSRMGVVGSPSYTCYHGMQMTSTPLPGAIGKPKQPGLIPEKDWVEERAKMRTAILESARKTATQNK